MPHNLNSLLGEIARLPKSWSLCACSGNKAPLGLDWLNHPLRLSDFKFAQTQGEFEALRLKSKKTGDEYSVPSSWVKSVGCLCGTVSGGLLFFDHDGKSCDDWIEKTTGQSLKESLPPSPLVSSGRPGRYQVIYRVPEQFWEGIQTTRIRTGSTGDDSKPEMVEFRWDGTQSIVLGEHPVTGGYIWRHHPQDMAIAEAPIWMIEQMLNSSEEVDRPTPHVNRKQLGPYVSDLCIPLTYCCSQSTRKYLDGVLDDGRNNTAAKLAADLIGTANHLSQIGQPFEGDPERIFFDWCSQVGLDSDKPKGQPKRVWESVQKGNPSPSLKDGFELRIKKYEREHNPGYLARNNGFKATASGLDLESIDSENGELTEAEKLRLDVGYFDQEQDPFVRALIENGIKKNYAVSGRRLENLVTALHPKEESGFDFLDELCAQTYKQIEEQSASDTVPGYLTGFLDVDTKLQGIQSGDLIIIAARPSMGKTALSLQIAKNIASNYEKTVAFFSMEMSKHQLNYRLLSSGSGVSSQLLRSGRLLDTDWPRVMQAMGDLVSIPLAIDDTPNINCGQIYSKLKKLEVDRGEIALVAIDYLQLMDGDGGDNRNLELSKITRRLKLIAREFNCPVVVLSQLSRSVEQRTNKRPIMADLRDSGAIEQDADQVFMLYRDEYYNSESPDRGVAEFIIAKNRNGPVGTEKLLFQSHTTTFYNLGAMT